MKRTVAMWVLGLVVASAAVLSGGVGSGRASGTPPGPPPVSVPAAPPAPTKLGVEDIKTRLDLRAPFNLGRGKVRLLAFFSPKCSHCQANARSIQAVILDKMDDPDIAVSIVWMPVSEADTREAIAIAASVIPDRRVRHYWDPQVTLNAQLRDAIQFDVNVRLYDLVLLYDREAMWNDRLPRPGYWMHEYRGAPGPLWNASALAIQVAKALASEPLDTPRSE